MELSQPWGSNVVLSDKMLSGDRADTAAGSELAQQQSERQQMPMVSWEGLSAALDVLCLLAARAAIYISAANYLKKKSKPIVEIGQAVLKYAGNLVLLCLYR